MRRPWLRDGVALAASTGGHLDLLANVRTGFADRDVVWIACPGQRARRLAEDGERLEQVPLFQAHPLNRVRNVLRSALLALRLRPRVVVSSGAGSVAPFCVFAKLLGARLIFVETMARVNDASATGSLLSRFSSSVLVQWPELRAVYPRALVCRPALWDHDAPAAPPDGIRRGTVVALGSHTEGFDRLLAVVDDAFEAGLEIGPATAQTGWSEYRPRHYASEPFVAPDELLRLIAGARYVICHAGSGIVSSALLAGHRPIVMARRHHLGEHFDDHQVQLYEKLASLDLIVPLDGPLTQAHLDATRRPRLPLDDVVLEPRMADVLGDLVLRD